MKSQCEAQMSEFQNCILKCKKKVVKRNLQTSFIKRYITVDKIWTTNLFPFPEIKDKKRWTCSNEPSLTTAILNTLFWRTPVSGTISLRNTIFVFNDSKNILFLCSCLSWNQLPVWIKKELFFSMNKIEEKMGIWHNGY